MAELLLEPAALPALNSALSDIKVTAASDIRDAGYGRVEVQWLYSVDVRYRGQASQLTVKLGGDSLDAMTLAKVRTDFEVEHQVTFGYSSPEESLEVVNIRLTARVIRLEWGQDIATKTRLEEARSAASGRRPA